VIERARPADAPAVAGLEEAALGPDAWSAGLVEQGIAGDVPTVHYLVARDDAVVVGYAAASVAGEVVELQRIAVDSAHRRGGVATQLLAEVVRLARADGADRLLLEVREDNAGAIAFYAGRGFTEIARRPRYYRDGAAAVVMELSLTGPERNVWATA
jgi:ribosomal-protein-alanine N-acetyltransferase